MARAGASSCVLRHRGSGHATSSPSRPRPCARSIRLPPVRIQRNRTVGRRIERAVPLDAPMLFSLLYMVLRGVLRLAPAGDERDREAEILVLRHQVKVLKRKACPKGTQTSDRAQAASSYSWMRPPNTSLLRMRAPEACGAGSGRGTGVLRSRPRWGLRALYLHENGRRGRLNERRTFTQGPGTGTRGFGR